MSRFRHIDTWVFDLDNTLYPASCRLFDQIDVRMGEFVSNLLGVNYADAKKRQKELFYNPRTTGFEAVSITTQPRFAFGNAVAVPKFLRFGPPGSRTPFDVAPNGKFVGLVTPGQTEFIRGSPDQVQVVLNWFEDLKARVPIR